MERTQMPIYVVGSINQDYILRVPTTPQPGETILASGIRKLAGGKGANQAVAAARLGGDVRLIGCVGDDDDGSRLLRHLRSEGVGVDEVEIVGQSPTGMAIVSVDVAGENSIIVVPGANFALTSSRVRQSIKREFVDGIIVMQAEVPARLIQEIAAFSKEEGARLVLNLAPYTELPAETLAVCDPLVVNETEAAALGGAFDPNDARLVALELAKRARSVVITLGARGAVWADQASSGVVPAHPVTEIIDTTGAGDAFIGAMCARLAQSASLAAACELGVFAGSFAVAREGAQSSFPALADLEEFGRAERVVTSS